MFNFRNCISPLRPYVPGRPVEDVKRDYNLTHVIKLASNENPRGCSDAVRGAVIETFAEAPVYPDGYCRKLREAVCKFYGFEPERLIFGAGTDEVISMLGKIFIEPGDECVTAAVTFSQYAAAVESMGGVMVYAPMREHGYDLEAILKCITPKTKMIFLANPNNPTGTVFSDTDQRAFISKVPSGVIVVFDEAYEEYVHDFDFPRTRETLRDYPNAILLKTFSKIYGLASFRVGFGAASPDVIKEMEKIRCPFNVTSQAQAAAEAALADQKFVRESFELNKKMKKYLSDGLEAMGFECIPSQANFIMADAKRDSRELFEKLMSKGYIVRPGAAFGMDTFLRITIGTEEQTEGFLNALKEVLK